MKKETLKETISNWKTELIIWFVVLIVGIVGVVLYYALNLKAINKAWNILNIFSRILIGFSGFCLIDMICQIKQRREIVKNPPRNFR